MPRKAAPSCPVEDLTTTLELLPLAELRPHPRNDGTHPPDEIAHLKASITTHGVYRNVVVAQDGTILAGHGVIAGRAGPWPDAYCGPAHALWARRPACAPGAGRR